jgi:DsbC/DsbD-like thiol-disulfide interchange protein
MDLCYSDTMKRRTFLASMLALPLARPAFAAEPWVTELVDCGRNGDQFLGLFKITLEDGWKTYWRVPGEAGIPPQITVTGENLAFFTIDYPLPQRIVDASGEAIGYHHEVGLIIRARAKDAAKPVVVDASAFYGVCKDICRPAKFAGSAKLGVENGREAEFSKWQALVPRLDHFASDPQIHDGHLILKISKPVDDIFVEGPEQLYFRKPEIANGVARFKIDGMKPSNKLMGVDLRLTASAQGMGLEQKVMLA